MKHHYTLRQVLTRCLALLCVATLGSALSVVAQTVPSQSELHRQLEAKRAQRPQRPPQQAPRPKASTAGGVQLYGCITYSEGTYWTGNPGIYTFNTADPNSFSLVKDGVNIYGGGTYGKGSLYAISYSESGTTITMPINLKQYNASTWEQQSFAYGMQFSCIATDLAYDPTSGQIYGCFSDQANYGTFETLGRITYGDNYTYSSETVGQLPERMVALTASASGQLYGIGASGTFYTIDKHSATCTAVGSTGVDPTPFYQSAACDYRSGKVYWAAMYGENWDTGIFEVDPTTGHATLVTDLGYTDNGTYTNDQITGLYIMQDEPSTATPPAAATALKADFADGSLSGTLSFTLPATDTEGQSLAGDLAYTVRANGETVAEGTGQPGEQVTAPVTVSQSGLTNFAVTVSRDGAESQPATLSVFVGNDAPAAPTDVKAEATGSTVKVSWTAPTTTANGGPIDTYATTFRVTRQPDGVVVADGTADTSCTDNPRPADMRGTYTYQVVALYEGRESQPATSNEVTVDLGIQLPYDNDFDEADQLSGFTMLDANEDGVVWQHNDFNGTADYPGAKAAADDWLVTPPIYMEAGNLYRFSFDASNSYPTERLEAAVGTELKAESFTHVVVSPTDISFRPRIHQLKGAFVPEVSGYYYFGIHAISKGDLGAIHVDNLHIDQTPATAPAAVTDLTATPGAEGAAEATITFHTPTQSINGQTLSGSLSVRIDFDGQELTTLSDLEPGQACSYTHPSVATGLHTYTVTPLSAEGDEGQSLDAPCFVGVDTPGAVRNLRAVEDLDHEGLIHLTWDAPESGQNGGYINPADLTYYVSVGTQGSDVNVGNNTQWDDQLTISGKQTYQGYSVYAVNNTGSGRNVWQTVTAIAGPALEAPVVESFPGVTLKSGPWLPQILQGEIGEAWWDVSSGLTTAGGTQDGDGGVLVFTAQSLGKSSRISTPKVDISHLDKPVLNFYAYFTGLADELRVTLSPDYGDYETLLTVKADSDTKGWHRFSLPLDKYRSSRFVRAGFEGTAVVSTANALAVDNVAFVNDATCDLMAQTLTGPEELRTGDPGEFTLSLRNNGSAPVAGADYEVTLLRNGQAVTTVQGIDLDADQASQLTLTDTPSVFDGNSNSYQAVINCEADAVTDNNSSSVITVPISHTTYPAPQGLEAANTGNGVSLNWQEPDLSTMPLESTIEDFDSYTAFDITGFGPWTTVDVDKQKTIRITLSTITGPLDYPHAGEPMAFQVFNSEEAGIPYASWDAHSGSQMLVCMSTSWTTDQATYVPNDDWLISPALYEGGQTISFFAKPGMSGDYVPEQLEVLYSTTGTELTDFVKLGETLDVTDVKAWQKFSCELPAGAKYFALRCVSNHKFALLLDDITYIPADASPDALKLLGYNVYRDHEQLNNSLVKEAAYTDTEAAEGTTCEYHVTAVYDKGESDPSEGARITVTAVSNVTASGAAAHVGAASRTIIVSGLVPGESVAVYAANGSLVSRRTATRSAERFGVEPGTYVVRVAGQPAVKIAVK